nr:MAG TPA: hypothetical protein [Caudoviricetes sp.]
MVWGGGKHGSIDDHEAARDGGGCNYQRMRHDGRDQAETRGKCAAEG